MTSHHPVVPVSNAAFQYGDGTEALRGVDLEMAAREVHGLLGGNGTVPVLRSLAAAAGEVPEGAVWSLGWTTAD